MISAIIQEVGRGASIVKFTKHHSVKDIYKKMKNRFGKPVRNTLTHDGNQEVIAWNFKCGAKVILYGDVRTQFGYRTIK